MIKLVLTEDIPYLLEKEEGIFFDHKSVDTAPASLSKTISAFANTSGGEIMVGVDEITAENSKTYCWRGFADQEAANPIFAVIEDLGGLDLCAASFLKADDQEGYLLHITVRKTQNVIKATNGYPYVRRNAQNLKVEAADAVRRLELDKGIASFEDETVNVPVETVSNSITAL